MWESPVNIFEIHEPIVEEINKQTEETIFKAIHRVGVDVNKEELIRAMQYDRNQYEKGYKDGYADAIDEFISRLEKHTQENWIDHQEYGITWADIKQIAEEMRGAE